MSQEERQRLMLAVKALMSAANRAQMNEDEAVFGVIAKQTAQNYRDLHKRIADLNPDDYYIQTVLALNVPDGSTAEETLALVRYNTTQLFNYLESLGKATESDGFTYAYSTTNIPKDDFRSFGEELSRDITRFTRETLRRALGSIDFDVEMGYEKPKKPPKPPKPPKPAKPPVKPDDEDGDDSANDFI